VRFSILLFVLGAWLLQQQSQLPDLNLAWLALPVLGGALYFRNSPAHVADSLWKLLALCAGFLWAAFLAQSRLGSALDAELEGRDLLLTGVVASLPQVNERGVRFEFDVEHDPRVPKHISLNWYHQRLKNGAIDFAPQLRAGRALATHGATAKAARQCESPWVRLRSVAPGTEHPRHWVRARERG
jgi:competence protein ComEC